MADLKEMLDQNNVYVDSFRSHGLTVQQDVTKEYKLRLIGNRPKDGRMYNLPTSSEVAALVPGDFETNPRDRDIIVESKVGKLKRISFLNPSYLPLQYPLLFPYGEDGFHERIERSGNYTKKPGYVTIRDFFAYRIHEHNTDSDAIFLSKKLFQQFLVDAYTMIETSRLNFIRFNQKKIRADMYKGLEDALLR